MAGVGRRRRDGWYPARGCLPGGEPPGCQGRAATRRRGGSPVLSVGRRASRVPGDDQRRRRDGRYPAPACLPGGGALRCREEAATAKLEPRSWAPAGRRSAGVRGDGSDGTAGAPLRAACRVPVRRGARTRGGRVLLRGAAAAARSAAPPRVRAPFLVVDLGRVGVIPASITPTLPRSTGVSMRAAGDRRVPPHQQTRPRRPASSPERGTGRSVVAAVHRRYRCGPAADRRRRGTAPPRLAAVFPLSPRRPAARQVGVSGGPAAPSPLLPWPSARPAPDSAAVGTGLLSSLPLLTWTARGRALGKRGRGAAPPVPSPPPHTGHPHARHPTALRLESATPSSSAGNPGQACQSESFKPRWRAASSPFWTMSAMK